MDLTKKTVREICEFGKFKRKNGEDAIYCKEGCGKNPPGHHIMMNIHPGEICIGTTFFSTGHSYPSSYVNLENMKKCSHREKSDLKK